MNDFKIQLEASEKDRLKKHWKWIYENTLILGRPYKNDVYSEDGAIQRSGADEAISVLIDGRWKHFFIDRKVREKRKDGRVYEDILLEYVSNDRTNTPGWSIKKDSITDIVYYLNKMNNTCYCFMFGPLRQFAIKNQDRYKIKPVIAKNKGYNTINAAFTEKELKEGLGSYMKKLEVPKDVL